MFTSTKPTRASRRRSKSNVQRTPATTTRRCPACGGTTKRVSVTTARAMLTPDALARLDADEDGDSESYRFCATATCRIVYTLENRGKTYETEEVRLPIFQKSEEPDRLVCYCFRHSVRDVEQDARSDQAAIPRKIRDKCRAGLDRCEYENPQGSCCLSNVGKVAKLARDPSSAKAPEEEGAGRPHDCCVSKTALSRARRRDGLNGERSGRFAAGGAVVAAMLSSACCWLPLSLVALGVSAGSIGTFFDAYRVHFLSLTGAMLVGGFYFVYRKPKCAPGASCATPSRRLQKLNKMMLWTATAFATVFALVPDYVGYVIGGDDAQSGGEEAPPSVSASPVAAAGVAHVYAIEGMSCEGCTAHVRDGLREVPGVLAVHVSYEDELARVTFAADAEPNDGAVLAAIEELGYEAKVRQTDDHMR